MDVYARNNPRVVRGWTFFDWANSAFALVITVAIFPEYFLAVVDPEIELGRMTMSASSLYAYAISAAYLLIAAFSPWLSGIADYGGRKMWFMRFFTIMGSVACVGLFFFQGMDTLWLGTGAFIIAMIGFAGGLVFYNSYLPEIVTEDQYDRVSARGFAMGFIGSVILLIINLLMLQKPLWFGLPEEGTLPARISFAMVGLWWLGFALIPFNRLPLDIRRKERLLPLAFKGWDELKKVRTELSGQEQTKRFLLSFFFYSAGAQTVLFLAATFAKVEMDFGTAELILLILLLQIIAIFGAYFFAWLSGRRGNKFAISVILLIWTSICLVAYFVTQKYQFYLLALAVGSVMGGIQAMSRSTYAKLIPENTPDTASYFSFYDVLEKVAIVSGTFSFGLIEQLTGDIRNSILVLTIFFVVSLLLFRRVHIQHGMAAHAPA
jgi:UMF1 family MFS transporter